MNIIRLIWRRRTKQEGGWNSVHVAAIQNDVTTITHLVSARGTDILHDMTPHGDTPLLLAAKYGCNEAVCSLLSLGADPDLPRSSLIELVKSRKTVYVASVETLIKHGANLDAVCSRDGMNALGWCAKTGNVAAMRLLLMKGALPRGSPVEGSRDTDPYFIAARHGHFDCLKLLLFYEDPDAMSLCPCGSAVVHQETPLSFASREGHVECVDFLLTCGANPDTRRFSSPGPSPLLLAASRGHLSIVKRLEPMTKTRKFYEGTRRSILHIAAENGHLEVVKFALSVGYDPNAETVSCNRTRAFYRRLERVTSPLSLAVSAGHTEIVRYLLKNGASMKEHDSLQCPLWQAFPNIPMMTTAFENGAAVCNCQREKMFTSQKLHLRAIKLLLDHGLDPEFRCEYSSFGFCVWQIYPANKQQCQSLLRLLQLWGNYWSKPGMCRHLRQSLQLCRANDILKSVMGRPPSLQQLCRVAIRKTLGAEKLSSALYSETLPLPSVLKDFVMCSDVQLDTASCELQQSI